jgi:DNA-directed RNA polymerase specialized sigma24 family protein
VPLAYLYGHRDGQPGPEDLAIGARERDIVLDAIAGLPRRERDALLMAAVAGLGVAAGSSALGISESAFKVRTFRARRRLAALMEQHRDE